MVSDKNFILHTKHASIIMIKKHRTINQIQTSKLVFDIIIWFQDFPRKPGNLPDIPRKSGLFPEFRLISDVRISGFPLSSRQTLKVCDPNCNLSIVRNCYYVIMSQPQTNISSCYILILLLMQYCHYTSYTHAYIRSRQRIFI